MRFSSTNSGVASVAYAKPRSAAPFCMVRITAFTSCTGIIFAETLFQTPMHCRASFAYRPAGTERGSAKANRLASFRFKDGSCAYTAILFPKVVESIKVVFCFFTK